MASVIDSFKEILNEKVTTIINVILTIPIFYAYTLYKANNPDAVLFIWIIVLLLLLVMAETTNFYLYQEKNPITILNPITLIILGIKLLISVFPVGFITFFITYYICNFINIEPTVDLIIKYILWGVAVSILITSFLCFIKEKKILTAYNIVKIFDRGGDTITATLKLIIFLVILNGLTFGVIGYIIYLFLGLGNIFTIFICYTIAFNIIVIGHHLAQMQYEIIDFPDREVHTIK